MKKIIQINKKGICKDSSDEFDTDDGSFSWVVSHLRSFSYFNLSSLLKDVFIPSRTAEE